MLISDRNKTQDGAQYIVYYIIAIIGLRSFIWASMITMLNNTYTVLENRMIIPSGNPNPKGPLADVAGPSPSAPIGIFDSGVGGLTVARAIIDQLPNEDLVYVGDSANKPYGPKSIATVRRLALNIMDDLVDAGVKLLVIACNSASAAVLRDARERYTKTYGIPVVEVIQPAVRRAVAVTKSGKIGVIGTEATISSRAYEDTFAAAPQLSIHSVACPKFVDFVEAGVTTGHDLLSTAQKYLHPLKAANVETVILGCTHYPLLSGAISMVMGRDVNLVSSAEETAKDVYSALLQHDLEKPIQTPTSQKSMSPSHRFMTTGDAKEFEKLARRFLGPEIIATRHVKTIAEELPTGTLAITRV